MHKYPKIDPSPRQVEHLQRLVQQLDETAARVPHSESRESLDYLVRRLLPDHLLEMQRHRFEMPDGRVLRLDLDPVIGVKKTQWAELDAWLQANGEDAVAAQLVKAGRLTATKRKILQGFVRRREERRESIPRDLIDVLSYYVARIS